MSCYRPNGTLITDESFAPCNSGSGSTEASMCCAINKPDADLCLSNGVCRWITNGQTQYFRNSCSDQNWDSPFCLNRCLDAALTIGESGNARLSLCPDGSWCCGDDAANNCCTSGATFQLAQTIGISSTSSSSSASSTAAASSSTLASSSAATTTSVGAADAGASASPTSSSSSSSGLSTGAQAGIGVGVALGALVVIGLVGLLVWRKKRRAQAPVHAHEHQTHELDAPPTQRMSELGTPALKPEVYAKVAPEAPRHELAG